jgi:putative addiction module killer protein
VFEIARYRQEDGKLPFYEWYMSLRDKLAQGRIFHRLHLVESGSLGDCTSVGEGVLELRLHV